MKKKNMKKILITLEVIIMGLFSFLGCGRTNTDTSTTPSYEQISQEEAKQLMDSNTDCVILDVRTIAEYETGYIPKAICIPNETIDESIETQLPDKEQLILVYCRSGNRSKQAAKKLVQLGYQNVKEFGGINTWSYEIEKNK